MNITERARHILHLAARPEVRKMKRNRGFTLIELLIVTAIIGILALFAFPALNKMMLRARFDGSVRAITVLLQQTRFEAIKYNETISVVIDLKTGTATSQTEILKEPQTPAEILNPPYVPGRLDPGERVMSGEWPVTLPQGVSFSAPPTKPVIEGLPVFNGKAVVTYLSDGSVYKTGAIRMGDRTGSFTEIRVSPRATARVRIQPWNGSTFQER